MSETDIKKLKSWFWTFLLGQLVVWLIAAAVFYGTVNTTLGQQSGDIKTLKETKADLSTVMRIKSDADLRDQMILDQLKEINTGQRDLTNLLITHMNKDVK
jgi:hypothetical protein